MKTEWKVYFDEGFWKHHTKSRAGVEIPVNKTFTWNGNVWHIPAVYSCAKGLVVDFCTEIEPEKIKAFLDKMELYGDREDGWSDEVRDEMHRSNPTDVRFDVTAVLNGKKLSRVNSFGFGRMPDSLRTEEEAALDEAEILVEHYGLDRNRGWSFHRVNFPWKTARRPKLISLQLVMEPVPEEIPGKKFSMSAPGDIFLFTHPITGVEHTLTMQGCEAQVLDTERMQAMHNGEYEFPSHYRMLTYTVEPEIPPQKLSVSDVARGDQPKVRPKRQNPLEPEAVAAVGIAVIGGADGPTAVFLGVNASTKRPRAACSALHFEPVPKVEWKMTFHEKMCEAFEVVVI